MILAHGVGSVYELPLPLPLYLGGAAGTVLLSFALRAFADRRPVLTEPRVLIGKGGADVLLEVLRTGALVCFILTFVFGILDPERGFTVAPLLFWVGLLIGTTTIQAICRGVWGRVDPWATLQDLLQLDARRARKAPPWWLGPLSIYALFWFELVSGKGFDPIAIITVLLGYTLYVLSFKNTFGDAWEEADPLSILFGFAGRSAPLAVTDDGIAYKGFLADLDDESPMSLALFASVFVLLGSTTLDNVRETIQWGDFLIGSGLDAIPTVVMDSVMLLLFSLPFFLPFCATMWLAGRWSPGSSVMSLARRFGWSLIPIGVAYLLAHNIPLLIVGLPQIVIQIAGRFGLDLFGGYVPSPKLVWFLEIAIIVGGHVIGVLAAHRTAMRISGSHSAAVKSHSALTGLMSLFTIVTLWLLSLPVVSSG
ncbi:MAG TPA: hypothetical protein VE174_12475 [Actinomycetota bacterium]|nr:hypothetical protein [Actinomycetota bacterium]